MERKAETPIPNPLTLAALAILTLLSGLLPAYTPWIGIGLLLLKWTPQKHLQTLSCVGSQAAAGLMLLQKLTSISANQNGAYPVGIFIGLWATQWALEKPSLKWTPSNPLAHTWPLILFGSSTALLQSLYSYPWHANHTAPVETLCLGLLLLAHTKTAFPLLQTTFFACLWSLTSSPELFNHLAPLIENVTLPSAWNSLYFPAKNPGAALSALCVSWLLLHHSKLNTLCALTLSGLICLQNSVGSLAIVTLIWCIKLLWTPLTKIPQKARGPLAGLAILIAVLSYQYLPEILASQNKDIRASGRVPSCLHLLQEWIPQNPSIGENPTFRRTPSGNLSEAIYLLSLKRTPTCNNILIESLVQYGIPITCLLVSFLALVILKTQTSLSGKILLGTPLVLVLNYSATGPFNWNEQGILWIIAALLPKLPPPSPTSPLPKIPLATKKYPQKRLIITLSALGLGALLWHTLQIRTTSWQELWETPLTVQLVDAVPSPLPQNHGAHLPAQHVLSTYRSTSPPPETSLRRPYLSNLLHVETDSPETSRNLRLKLEEKSDTPIRAIAGGWTQKSPAQNLALLLTPIALLAILTLAKKFPRTIVASSVILSTLFLAASAIAQPKESDWKTYSFVIEHPTPTPEEAPWAYIWRREILKTSSGEALQFLLARDKYPSDFFFEKSTSPKPRNKKPEKTLLKVKTQAPKETLETALNKLPHLHLLPSKEVDSLEKYPKKTP
jgi:hypothetical protein